MSKTKEEVLGSVEQRWEGDLGLGWCRRSPPQFSVIHLLIPLWHGIGMHWHSIFVCAQMFLLSISLAVVVQTQANMGRGDGEWGDGDGD